MKYAEQTSTISKRSREKIERTLGRYGATSFVYMWQGKAALILFEYKGKRIKFRLDLPSYDDDIIVFRPMRDTARSNREQKRVLERTVRRKWQALGSSIKSKLKAVESCISVFEEGFMANIVLPNGQTTAEYILPQIDEAYRLGEMPPMLPMIGDKQ